MRPGVGVPARLLPILLGALGLIGCYTEIGNPGKESKVTATF